MKQIFLAPRSNETAYKNYISSMQGRPKAELQQYLSPEEQASLSDHEFIHAWGCQPSLEGRWASMNLGDYVLFYAKGKFMSVGELVFKKKSSDLALALWPRNKDTNEPWSCVFFVDKLVQIDLSLEDFNQLTGYELSAVMGFMPVRTGVEKLASKFGSVEGFVESLKTGFELDQIEELSSLSSTKISQDALEEIARFDELTREKDDAQIEEALANYAKNAKGKKPEQVTKQVTSYKRNRKMVDDLKQKYQSKCQICGFTFQMANGKYYSEAAHIIPISSGQAGVDSPDNIWILCANHHKMLDTGAITALDKKQVLIDGKHIALANS